MNVALENNAFSFVDICHKHFGRKVIYTNATEINGNNVVDELNKALKLHWHNRKEIEYLEKYYLGQQPILARAKHVRPEINNKIVENHAFEIVEHKVADLFGEPIQYVFKGDNQELSQNLNSLNDILEEQSKEEVDIALGRWQSICGTSYRYIWTDKASEYPFEFCSENPKSTFVFYSSDSGHRPMFSVQQRKDTDNTDFYFVYTTTATYKVKKNVVVDSGTNGYFAIPIIEYPNNERRLSDIEIVITMLDAINKEQSDRINGVEQFVASIIKFVNCDIEEDEFLRLIQIGMLKVKNPQGGTADVEMMSNELDQENTQISKEDLYNNVLIVEGMPSREKNTGGDTGSAVYMRNGFEFSERRAELKEPTFKKSERKFIRLMLEMLRKSGKDTGLSVGNIEIKILRSKTDNMSVKANVLILLLQAGIHPKIAIKTCNLFSDSELVYLESKKYLDVKYLTEQQASEQSAEELKDTLLASK